MRTFLLQVPRNAAASQRSAGGDSSCRILQDPATCGRRFRPAIITGVAIDSMSATEPVVLRRPSEPAEDPCLIGFIFRSSEIRTPLIYASITDTSREVQRPVAMVACITAMTGSEETLLLPGPGQVGWRHEVAGRTVDAVGFISELAPSASAAARPSLAANEGGG